MATRPTKPINLEIVTPERQVLAEPADAVVLPAHDGELGVLHDRAPLLCELGIGQLRYTRAGRTARFFVDGGFAQVLDNHVTVLTKQAVPAGQITAEWVAEAEAAAQASGGSGPDALLARDRARMRASALRRLRRKT